MDELFRLSASEIATAVRNRTVSAVEVTEAHIARLDAVNPLINAVVQDGRTEALAAAQTVDAQIAQGEDPGPMAGVPCTIKVNIDQEGFANTNGLTVLKDNMATHDSPVVANIRKAGGILVGRTNTPAFSLRWFTKNNLHGQTLNPRNPAITPGGSSGGASAAVAAGICAIGHGTDIAGSVRFPAYACGLHGLRPTLGRIPAHMQRQQIGLSARSSWLCPDRSRAPSTTSVCPCLRCPPTMSVIHGMFRRRWILARIGNALR
jgi:amidase